VTSDELLMVEVSFMILLLVLIVFSFVFFFHFLEVIKFKQKNQQGKIWSIKLKIIIIYLHSNECRIELIFSLTLLYIIK